MINEVMRFVSVCCIIAIAIYALTRLIQNEKTKHIIEISMITQKDYNK